MAHHNDIVEYFKEKGVSAILLFRRNFLRRMISVLANSYDRDAKLLNGTHKSHVHSPAEVSALSLSICLSPGINCLSINLILKKPNCRLRFWQSTNQP